MKALPEPINQIRADINSAGITIHSFPVGTAFFEGHPKIAYRKDPPRLDSYSSSSTGTKCTPGDS